MFFKDPPEILHSEKRPACYRAMIEACAHNIHLRKQATALLMYYAGQANYFRPALATVEKATGIQQQDVSKVRKRLHDHGLIAYHEYPGFIYISWRNIRAYARL